MTQGRDGRRLVTRSLAIEIDLVAGNAVIADGLCQVWGRAVFDEATPIAEPSTAAAVNAAAANPSLRLAIRVTVPIVISLRCASVRECHQKKLSIRVHNDSEPTAARFAQNRSGDRRYCCNWS